MTLTPAGAADALGVPLTATPREVQTAYRRRARLLHPDLVAHADPSRVVAATEEFAALNLAREVLLGRSRESASTGDEPSPNGFFSAAPARAPSRAARRRGSRRRGLLDGRRVVLGVASAVVLVGLGAAAVSAVLPRTDAVRGAVDAAPAARASPTRAGATMPAAIRALGYTDAGNGLAWRWDDPTFCRSAAARAAATDERTVRCWNVAVLAYARCPAPVRATIVASDGAGRDESIDGEAIDPAARPVVLEFDTTTAALGDARLTGLTCA